MQPFHLSKSVCFIILLKMQGYCMFLSKQFPFSFRVLASLYTILNHSFEITLERSICPWLNIVSVKFNRTYINLRPWLCWSLKCSVVVMIFVVYDNWMGIFVSGGDKILDWFFHATFWLILLLNNVVDVVGNMKLVNGQFHIERRILDEVEIATTPRVIVHLQSQEFVIPAIRIMNSFYCS